MYYRLQYQLTLLIIRTPLHNDGVYLSFFSGYIFVLFGSNETLMEDYYYYFHVVLQEICFKLISCC